MTAAPIVVEGTMQQVVADPYCTNPRASLFALQMLRLHHRLRDQISAEELEQMHQILDVREADVQKWEATATRFELEEKLGLASIPAVKEGEKQIRTNEWLFLVMRENPDLARLHRSMTSKLAARHIGPGDWARLALKFWLSDSIPARIPVYAESSISTTQESEATVVVAKQDIYGRIEQVTNPVNNEELVASAATLFTQPTIAVDFRLPPRSSFEPIEKPPDLVPLAKTKVATQALERYTLELVANFDHYVGDSLSDDIKDMTPPPLLPSARRSSTHVQL